MSYFVLTKPVPFFFEYLFTKTPAIISCNYFFNYKTLNLSTKLTSLIYLHFRLWDIECGACLRVLEGHEELVRCIRFDNKRIVSGAYDG